MLQEIIKFLGNVFIFKKQLVVAVQAKLTGVYGIELTTMVSKHHLKKIHEHVLAFMALTHAKRDAKVGRLNISRMVGPRITKFYEDTGYDIAIYFWSELIAKKTVENVAFDSFRWNQ